MLYAHDIHTVVPIIDLVDDAIVADADPVELVFTVQLLDTARKRIRSELVDLRGDLLLYVLGKCGQFTERTAREVDGVRHMQGPTTGRAAP